MLGDPVLLTPILGQIIKVSTNFYLEMMKMWGVVNHSFPLTDFVQCINVTVREMEGLERLSYLFQISVAVSD